jgi:hypothetical protein
MAEKNGKICWEHKGICCFSAGVLFGAVVVFAFKDIARLFDFAYYFIIFAIPSIIAIFLTDIIATHKDATLKFLRMFFFVVSVLLLTKTISTGNIKYAIATFFMLIVYVEIVFHADTILQCIEKIRIGNVVEITLKKTVDNLAELADGFTAFTGSAEAIGKDIKDAARKLESYLPHSRGKK